MGASATPASNAAPGRDGRAGAIDVEVAPDAFVPGLYDPKRQLYEVLRPDVLVPFRRLNGRPVAFDVRDESDSLQATGTRRP